MANGNKDINVYAYLQGCKNLDPDAGAAYARLDNLWDLFLMGVKNDLPDAEFTELDVFNERLEKIAAEANVPPEVCFTLRNEAAAQYTHLLEKEAQELQKPKTLEQSVSLELGEDGLPIAIITSTKTVTTRDVIPEPYRSLYELYEGDNKIENEDDNKIAKFIRRYITAAGLAPKLVQKEGAMGIFDNLTAQESCRMFVYFLEKNILDKYIEKEAKDLEVQEFLHKDMAEKLLFDLTERLKYCVSQPVTSNFVTEEYATELLKKAQDVTDKYVARKVAQPMPKIADSHYSKK